VAIVPSEADSVVEESPPIVEVPSVNVTPSCVDVKPPDVESSVD